MAAQQVSPMQLLVSIVERGKGLHLIEHYKTFKLLHHNQAAGRGTASSHLLDALGFGTSERDIVLTFGPRDTVRQLMDHLRDEDRSKLDARGIAFSLNISGMNAIMAVCLSRLEELELYLDGSTLEVFVNGGWATLTSRIFGAGDTLALDAFAGQAEFCPMGEFVIADARENGV